MLDKLIHTIILVVQHHSDIVYWEISQLTIVCMYSYNCPKISKSKNDFEKMWR